MYNNPFSIKTPESLSSKEIADLFIDVFSDFHRLLAVEHTFMHGARGTGKSMMFRYVEPIVQIEAKKYQNIVDIPYFAIHMPIKRAAYSLTELERLEGAPYWLIAENFLIINASLCILQAIIHIIEKQKIEIKEEFQEFLSNLFNLLENCGYYFNNKKFNDLKDVISLFNKESKNLKQYIAKLAFVQTLQPFNYIIFGYDDFFIPFVRLIKKLSCCPNGPVFLMIDDADNLAIRMQKILNTWVSYRTCNELCLKISTQQKYKTWRTTNNILIESPHDFHEIDITSVYTSNHFNGYYKKVEQITQKRLQLAGIDVSPQDFFPEDQKQNEEKEKIKVRLLHEWEKKDSKPKRKEDVVYRYTSSEYMKILASKKHQHNYSYAGFRSLVDLSSGMIRSFLEPASRMFAEMSKENKEIKSIPVGIQQKVIQQWSEEYLLDEFDRLKVDEHTETGDIGKFNKLKHLINSLGSCFQRKLLSDDSERRFISFVVPIQISSEVQEVLDLGVEWGYLTRKTIARKEGAGRNNSYTLNRRLAPYFKLDPSGYAAHMSVSKRLLDIAIVDPDRFVRERLKEKEGDDNTPENLTLLLDDAVKTE